MVPHILTRVDASLVHGNKIFGTLLHFWIHWMHNCDQPTLFSFQFFVAFGGCWCSNCVRKLCDGCGRGHVWMLLNPTGSCRLYQLVCLMSWISCPVKNSSAASLQQTWQQQTRSLLIACKQKSQLCFGDPHHSYRILFCGKLIKPNSNLDLNLKHLWSLFLNSGFSSATP